MVDFDKNDLTENFFMKSNELSPTNPFDNGEKVDFVKNDPVTQPTKRLNGYDSTILNNANSDGKDEENLSIEYRIKEKEALIKDLNLKITSSEKYGTQNESLSLKAKRQRLYEELNSLKTISYGGKSIEKTPHFHEKFKKTMPMLYKMQEFVSRNVLAKISKKVNSVVALSDSLEQLSQISKSVDELIDLNVPYGEKIQNYEKLTDYLNQANLIHSKIIKSLKK